MSGMSATAWVVAVAAAFATCFVLFTNWVHAKHSVPSARRSAAQVRESARLDREVAGTARRMAAASGMSDGGRARTLRIAEDSDEQARAADDRARQWEREADRLWTWPFTVRKETDR